MTSKLSAFGSLQDRLAAQRAVEAFVPRPRLVEVQRNPGVWQPGLLAGWLRDPYTGAWRARVAVVHGDGFDVFEMDQHRVRPATLPSTPQPETSS